MSIEPSPEKIERAFERAAPCRICPRHCEVNRPEGEKGYCGTGRLPLVASAAPHFGEEKPLVGRGGSGTIFFAGCNLGCVFCQNYRLSQGLQGQPRTPEELSELMLELQGRGCENINLVTPSHVVPLPPVRGALLAP